jgi:DNA-directed RNA polymerase subunit RPC12/RpoP
MYYRANGGAWSPIASYDGGAWSFTVNTKDFDDGALVLEVKAAMGEDETEPNDCYLAVEVDNIVPIPETPADDDDDTTTEEPEDDDDDGKIMGYEPYDLVKFGLLLLLVIVISIVILVIIARLRGPRDAAQRPYFAEPLEQEPDMELEEEEEVFADVTMAADEVAGEKTPAASPAGPEAPRPGQPAVEGPGPEEKKAGPQEGMDWDDSDFVDEWHEPETAAPPGLELKKETRTVAPVICPACKKTFDIIDDGKRPLRTKCSHCGKEGLIKGEKGAGDVKGGLGIRCPSCKTMFQVKPEDEDAVCPSCGAVGKVPK